jgi:hypothetical protein
LLDGHQVYDSPGYNGGDPKDNYILYASDPGLPFGEHQLEIVDTSQDDARPLLEISQVGLLDTVY